MNRSLISKQVNKEMIDELKNNTQALLSFLQNQNDGIIVYVLEKLGRLENGYSREPLLNLLNNQNENIRALSLKNLAKQNFLSKVKTMFLIYFVVFKGPQPCKMVN